MDSHKLFKILYFVLLIAIFLFVFIPKVFAADYYFEKGENINLKIPCLNNDTQCDNTIVCNVSVTYPNGSLLIENKRMSQNIVYFNYTILSTNVIGDYYGIIICSNGILNGYDTFTFEVNYTGFEENMMQAVIYCVAFLFCLVLFILCLVLCINTQFKNNFVMGEKGDYLIDINYGGYVKLFLFLMSYFFFWVSLFLAWQVSVTFILNDVIASILNTLFIFFTYLWIPIFLLITLVGFMKHITDSKILQFQKRGLNPR